jgi:hypothetical protein
VPFQTAIRFVGIPPAVVNSPATARSPFGSVAIARTSPFTPGPRGAQVTVVGSYVTIRFALIVPAPEKSPANTQISGSGPAPSRSQRCTAYTSPLRPAGGFSAIQGLVHCANAGAHVAASNSHAGTRQCEVIGLRV